MIFFSAMALIRHVGRASERLHQLNSASAEIVIDFLKLTAQPNASTRLLNLK
jgi:hypothetical protein